MQYEEVQHDADKTVEKTNHADDVGKPSQSPSDRAKRCAWKAWTSFRHAHRPQLVSVGTETVQHRVEGHRCGRPWHPTRPWGSGRAARGRHHPRRRAHGGIRVGVRCRRGRGDGHGSIVEGLRSGDAVGYGAEVPDMARAHRRPRRSSARLLEVRGHPFVHHVLTHRSSLDAVRHGGGGGLSRVGSLRLWLSDDHATAP